MVNKKGYIENVFQNRATYFKEMYQNIHRIKKLYVLMNLNTCKSQEQLFLFDISSSQRTFPSPKVYTNMETNLIRMK